MAEYTATNLNMFTTRTRLGIDDNKRAFLEWLSLEDRERQEKYRMYRDYYDGKHDAMLTKRQAEFLELKPHQDFSANYCPLVVDELERRMTVSGFDAEGNKELGGVNGVLWRWWRLDKMDSGQADAHLASIRDGDAYVIVGWNNKEGRPTFTPELAYDGSEGVKVHYSDETGEIVYATKRWLIRTDNPDEAGVVRRMNVYYEDRMERYVSDDNVQGGEWRGFSADGEPAVISWVHPRTGEPLGVPVFHLRYRPSGYRWGRSILEDVIPMQNALNKAIIDVIAAADTTGFRIYWATGTDLTDEDGEPIKVHPGVILTATDPEASFGVMEGEDLRPLIEVVDMCKVTIAQISETPMHLFQVSGQNASEGAQKQQEVGMINKAEKYGISLGNFWEDCMRQAIKLANAFSSKQYPEDLILSTVWADMEVRDKTARRKETAETAKIWVEAGAGLEEAAIEAGIPEDRAKAMSAAFVALVGGGLVPGVYSQVTEGDDNADNDDRQQQANTSGENSSQD